MRRIIVAKTYLEYYDVDEVTQDFVDSLKDSKGKVSILQNIQIVKDTPITEDVVIDSNEDLDNILLTLDHGINDYD